MKTQSELADSDPFADQQKLERAAKSAKKIAGPALSEGKLEGWLKSAKRNYDNAKAGYKTSFPGKSDQITVLEQINLQTKRLAKIFETSSWLEGRMIVAEQKKDRLCERPTQYQ